jgi:hypothetical protein
MTKTYPYIKYIPHLLVLRVIVVGPFFVAQKTTEFVSNYLEKFLWKLEDILPECYVEKWVEWEQLPLKNQRAIEQIAEKRKTTKENLKLMTAL